MLTFTYGSLFSGVGGFDMGFDPPDLWVRGLLVEAL